MIISLLTKLSNSVIARRDAGVSTPWQIIGWWELRRIVFNIIIGIVGMLTLGISVVIALAIEVLFNTQFLMPDPPILAILGVILYGLMANICYTFGWIAELTVRRVWPTQSQHFANMSFTLGLTFSILLTLVPILVVAFFGIIVTLAQSVAN